MMKSKFLPALAVILSIGLSASAFAQGRHDEKPHAMGKPASVAQENMAPTGGRHDAGGTTHGAVKAKAKKDNPKAVDDKGSK